MSHRNLFILSLLFGASQLDAATIKIDSHTFTLPDGFIIEKIASTPLVDRPITADFDEHGNLYIADSSGSNEPVQKQLEKKPHRIVKLIDSDGDGKFDKQTIFADKMMFPEGTMWHAGSLYVAAPPSIWKLTDTNNDGIADERKEWFNGKTLTGCANDLHGPYLGPDGWIYWCKGAFAEQTYDRKDKPPFVTKASHIFRAKPDGTHIEPVMTGGMDNPVDVVFTATGERIFTTTFFQHPGGGKRDGLIHAIYGGVYGKVHNVIDNHPRTSPEVMPVLAHLGPAAPAGLTRYQSDTFGADYRDNLFSACFNLRKIVRHQLTPSGATFTSKDEDFLTCDNLDFHPTDVIEDADGSLIVIDTGGWYKLCCPTSQLVKPDMLGAVYRIRRADAKAVEDPRGKQIAWEKIPTDQLAKLLDDPRFVVRRRAMLELPASKEDGLNAIRRIAFASESPRSRLNAVWAESSFGDGEYLRVARAALKDKEPAVRQAGIHSVSVWRELAAVPDLILLLSDPDLHIRRAAAEALGRMGDSSAVISLLDALKAKDVDQVLEHSLIYALIEIADPKETAAGLAVNHYRVQRGALIALDQMPGKHLKVEALIEALTAGDDRVRNAAVWIAGRHPEWGSAIAAALKNDLERRMHLDDAQLRRQLASLSNSPDIQALIATHASRGSRVALSAMAEARLKEIPQSWLDALRENLTKSDDPTLAITAARAFASHKEAATALAPDLIQAAARMNLPPATRLAAVAALPSNTTTIHTHLFTFLLSQLSGSQPLANRLLAADALNRAKLTPDQLKLLLEPLKSAGPLELERLLSAFDRNSDPEIAAALIASLKDAKSLRSLSADSIRRRFTRHSDDVKKQAEDLIASLNPDATKQRAHLEEMLKTLPSGDLRRGQILFNSDKAACSTCHAIGYLGGTVGPDLTRIGATRSERDLLESIVFPSASFTQSYTTTIVDTTDNDRQSGILKKDDSEEVILLTGPNQELSIPRAKVKSIRPDPISIMPAGLDQQISQQDLADLLAFLKACK